MSSCRVCGRQVETSDSGQAMPCECCLSPFGAALRYALADCVGPAERDDPEPVDMGDLIGE